MQDIVDEIINGWADQRPELDSSALAIVVRVQLLGRLLSADAGDALQALGLKLWEYDVLSALRRQRPRHEMPASALARASMLTTGTITTRIDGLEERGLVKRRADKNDRRGVNVRLTEKGKQLVDQAVATRMAIAEDQLRDLGVADRGKVSDGLRRILSRIGAD